MAAILAIWNRNGVPVAPGIVESMLAAGSHRAVDGQRAQYFGPVALAHQHFYLTPQDVGETQPSTDDASGLVITCDARLDDRESLIERLSAGDRRGLSDAQLVLRSFLRWGPDCVDHLMGDFAFVVWDPKERRLFIARDALGARDLCYLENDRLFVAASEIRQLLAHPSARRRVDERKVADYLVSDWSDQEHTFFDGISYCPPAHCGFVTRDSRGMRRYWALDSERTIRRRDGREYANEFRALLEVAVRDRTRVNGSSALSLSGGPDSASLAALTSSGRNGARPVCISYVFDEYPECDERRYIQPVLDRFGLDSMQIKGDRLWPLSDPGTWPVFEDFAGQDPFVRLPLAVVDRAAARGCRVVLNGHFSDVLLAGGKYWAIESLMRGRFGGLLAGIAEAPNARGELAQLVRYLLSTLLPSRLKALRHRGIPSRAREHHAALDPGFVGRTGLRERIGAVGTHGHGLARVRQQRAAHLTWGIEAQGSSAFRCLSNRRGVEILDPFWDRRLIEYAMAVPAWVLGRPPYAKRLLREAMAGALPDAVLWRKDKTSLQALFRAGLAVHEGAEVRRLLADSQVVQRGYVRQEWIAEQLKMRDDGAAHDESSYTLWLVLCLELWLRRNWPF